MFVTTIAPPLTTQPHFSLATKLVASTGITGHYMLYIHTHTNQKVTEYLTHVTMLDGDCLLH